MAAIEFMRGDSQPIKFRIMKSDDTQPEMSEISTLILTCRKRPREDSEILFQKNKVDFTFSEGYFRIMFQPEDTENLDYGTYAFDIECTLNNGYRKSLYSEFKITNEVTMHRGV